MKDFENRAIAPRLRWSPIMSLGVLAVVCVIELAIALLWPFPVLPPMDYSCAQIANAIDIAGDCRRQP